MTFTKSGPRAEDAGPQTTTQWEAVMFSSVELARTALDAAEMQEEAARRRYATARPGRTLLARGEYIAAARLAERCRLALEEAETQEAEGDVDADYERLVDLRSAR